MKILETPRLWLEAIGDHHFEDFKRLMFEDTGV
jgi:hypothetical protein